MTNQSKDIGPKQLAWLEQYNPGFKYVRKYCGEVIDRAREAAGKALAEADQTAEPAREEAA